MCLKSNIDERKQNLGFLRSTKNPSSEFFHQYLSSNIFLLWGGGGVFAEVCLKLLPLSHCDTTFAIKFLPHWGSQHLGALIIRLCMSPFIYNENIAISLVILSALALLLYPSLNHFFSSFPLFPIISCFAFLHLFDINRSRLKLYTCSICSVAEYHYLYQLNCSFILIFS